MPVRRNNGKPHNGAAGANSRARYSLLALLLESIDEGVANVTSDGTICYANSRFVQLLSVGLFKELLHGDSASGLVGINLRRLISGSSWNDLERALRQAEHGPTEGELRVETSSSSPRIIHLTLRPVRHGGESSIAVTASEVTELLEKNRVLEDAEASLKDSEASLHTLSARILQLQDQERRRIARDLHDITGQELAVVVMSLNQVTKSLDQPGSDLERIVLDAVQLVRKVEDEIRTLSYVLHPPLLDDFGLGSALQWYADGFQKRSGIAVEVDCPKNVPRLVSEKETALFRVVQEGLTNVLRHSGSRRAWIRLAFDSAAVRVSVEDEGRGIANKSIAQNKTTSSVGIQGMRERLQQFGGSLQVSPRSRGTKVVATIPFQEADRTVADSEAAAAQLASAARGDFAEAANAAPAAARKRILIADDHEVTRRGIRTLLQAEQDLEICGEAQDGIEAMAKARELNPDLVIMDVTMPHAGGFTAANAIRGSGAPAKILFFTTHDFGELEKTSRIAGFEGFVRKTNAAHDLLRAVRAVLEGDKFYNSEVIRTAGGGSEAWCFSPAVKRATE